MFNAVGAAREREGKVQGSMTMADLPDAAILVECVAVFLNDARALTESPLATENPHVVERVRGVVNKVGSQVASLGNSKKGRMADGASTSWPDTYLGIQVPSTCPGLLGY